jgi:hypothetical protein
MMDLLKSKKFLDMEQQQVILIVSPFLTFIGAQGLADIGKEKAKVETIENS